MSQISIFETENNNSNQPLAARMRPRNLDEYVGQEHLVGKGKVLRTMIERDSVSSMIFWGPPGVGKTTLASTAAKLEKRVVKAMEETVDTFSKVGQ